MPRYVILEHDWPRRHWDFLLEAGEVLRAWRLFEEPQSGKAVPAEVNFDHRLLYLDFEGPLSGDRGSVKRWDAGRFEWIENQPDGVIVEMTGGKMTGRYALKHGLCQSTEPRPSGSGHTVKGDKATP